MSLALTLLSELADLVSARLREADGELALRIDYLSRVDAEGLCRLVQARVSVAEASVHVLIADRAPENELEMTPQKAIELRNRKVSNLCLLIPSDVADSAASSLANAFAIFDLEEAFARCASSLLAGLPQDVRSALGPVRLALRSRSVIRGEAWCTYLCALREEPTLARAGLELWRLGLIPDGGDDFQVRLIYNREAAGKLARPARAHATVQDRVESLGLLPGDVKSDLLAYLREYRLSDASAWLPGLAALERVGHISFERWRFASEVSDLECIEVLSLLTATGAPEKYALLAQPDGPGGQLLAYVGKKKHMVIKWSSVPDTPADVSRWRVQLMSVDAEDDDPDLPVVSVTAKTRRARIPLDIDLETLSGRAVRAQVTALDEYDTPLRGTDGEPTVDYSDEFWLADQTDADSPEGGPSGRATVASFPLARLRALIEMGTTELTEQPGSKWESGALDFYSLTLNGRRTVRIGMGSPQRELETFVLAHPEQCGRLSARIRPGDTVDVERDVKVIDCRSLRDSELATRFWARRKELFRLIRGQEPRDLVETCSWGPDLTKKVRAYAAAYRDLLGADDRELAAEALRIDMLRLSIVGATGEEKALVVLPTHPLRMLWFAAYADLLKVWEQRVVETSGSKHGLLDFSLLDRVAPLNFPALVHYAGEEAYLFAQNLRFFWGVALPIASRDPARRVAAVAAALGLPDDEVGLTDLPSGRVTEELHSYLEVHPYVRALRLSVINPGSGTFVADALRRFYARKEDLESQTTELPKMEVIAHSERPLPLTLPSLARLQRDLYEVQPGGTRQHLVPFFTVALRAIDEVGEVPGGAVNATMLIDYLQPELKASPSTVLEESCSFYGLLARLTSSFESDDEGCSWFYHLAYSDGGGRVRHPAQPGYTAELVETQQRFLAALGANAELDGSGTLPAICVHLSQEQRMEVDRIHARSDWVVTLDRFLGVELFDDPSDVNVAASSRKYLLDHAPEFLEGLGHRMMVTTTHRGEIEGVLSRAMSELGFDMVEESAGEVLEHLKTISGRLALRVLGDDGLAREAVSLGVVAAYLKARGELDNSILVPVDAHPELFGVHRVQASTGPRLRCDLIRVQLTRGRMTATFIEVKSRSAGIKSTDLLDRIADQVESTEDVFRELFFRESERLDHVLQRSRLATILRFYLRRGRRYGLVSSEEDYERLWELVSRLETGVPDLSVKRWGFIVNLLAEPDESIQHRGTLIRLVTAKDVFDIGMSVSVALPRTAALEEPASPPPVTANDTLATPVTTEEADDVPDATPEEDFPAVVEMPDVSGGSESEGTEWKQEPEDVGVEKTPSEGSSEEGLETVEDEPGDQDQDDRRGVSVELGRTVIDREPVLWQPSVQGSPHMFVLGIPGQGKSVTVARVLCETDRQSLAAIVLDFHGEFADPDGPYAAECSPLVLDASLGLPFSPFEAGVSSRPEAWKTNCYTASEIFQYICDLGDIQRDGVYRALRESYEDIGYGVGEGHGVPTVSSVFQKLEELEAQGVVKNVVPRVRPLLEFGLFTDDSEPEHHLQEMLLKGLVVDVHNLELETQRLAAGAFLLRRIYRSMTSWGVTDHLRLAIVLDEAHRLARDVTLPKIMKEGRKFGVAIVVSSQGLADFHQDVVGNAGTKIVFRTNHLQSKKVAGFLKGPKNADLASAIEQLGVGQAYVQTPEMPTAERVFMTPARPLA